ncbi:MAG TPA: ABC transporter substrate-binding protein [Chloroflexota bacterium]|nr:ABC transporter substrate-binding protein [Chloroflexota bacterium]
MSRLHSLLNVLLGAALAGVLFACRAAAPEAATGAPATTPPAPAAGARQETPSAPLATHVPTPPQVFHLGGQAPATDAGIFVAMDRGYFAEQGVDLDYVQFASGSDMVPALAMRQLDGAGIAVNAATINAVARGIEIKAVADKGSLAPGFGWEAFLVRKDLWDSGRFQGPADLRGLSLATTPPINGGAGFPALERVLKQGGLTQDDLQQVEAMNFADLNAALASGALDVAIQLEPLVQAAVAQGIAVRWRGLDEIYPNQQIGVIAYGPSITVDNPSLGRAFMVAYLQGVRDYNRAFTTGEDKSAIVAAIAKYSTVKDPKVIEAMAPIGLRPDGHVNVDSLIEDQQFYVEKGTVPTAVDMHQLVDNSYVDAALAQLP